MQRAHVKRPGQQVAYFGNIREPGEYFIVVKTHDGSVGEYNLRLDKKDGPPCGTESPSSDTPIEVALDTPLNCSLTPEDGTWDSDAGEHFGKKFQFTARASGDITITGSAQAFTPWIGIPIETDPQGNTSWRVAEGSVNISAAAGTTVIFAVIAKEPGKDVNGNLTGLGTGPFTVEVKSGNPDFDGFGAAGDSAIPKLYLYQPGPASDE